MDPWQEFQGVCDASESAYASVIYCRAMYKVRLLRMMIPDKPIKRKFTLPKLGLKVGMLLAELMKMLIYTMELRKAMVYS